MVAVFTVVEPRVGPLPGFFGLNSKRGASTCSINKLAAIAFSVSLTASATACPVALCSHLAARLLFAHLLPAENKPIGCGNAKLYYFHRTTHLQFRRIMGLTLYFAKWAA